MQLIDLIFMYCRQCGKEVAQDAKFCPFCGYNMNSVPVPPATAQPAQPGMPAVPTPPVSQYHVTQIGKRFLHLILDWIFSLITFVLVVFIISAVAPHFFGSGLYYFLSFFYIIIYYLVFESIWQRTPAKWLTKTKVVMNDGSKPDFMHILGRTFSRIIPFESLSFLFSPVGWHDRFSGTLVVPDSYGPAEIAQIDKSNQRSTARTVIIVIVIGVVVIAVLGLLASIVLLSLNSARAKARDAQRLADTRVVSTGLELYYNDKGSYPDSLAKLQPKYIKLPSAPTPPDGTCSAAQNEYAYASVGAGDYKFTFCLGGETGGYSAGPHTLGPKGIDPAASGAGAPGGH
jgi:uncharacterized RDD family membrane protein YckC/type II secretory pathway pseudopilin PulG